MFTMLTTELYFTVREIIISIGDDFANEMKCKNCIQLLFAFNGQVYVMMMRLIIFFLSLIHVAHFWS